MPKYAEQLELPTITRGDHRKDFYQLSPPITVEGYGTCLKCGARNQDLGNGLCLECYDEAGAVRQTYYRRKLQGLCVQCGGVPDNGQVRCSECLSKMNAWNSLWRSRQKKGDRND